MPPKIKRILFILLAIFLLVFAFSLSVVLMLALLVIGGSYYVFIKYIKPLFSKNKKKREVEKRVFEAEYEIIDEDDKRDR